MTREEIGFVIDTLETAIEWAEYADDYFKKKHGLEQDKENASRSIELLKALKAPKTCDGCKHPNEATDDTPCEWCSRFKQNKFYDYYEPKDK